MGNPTVTVVLTSYNQAEYLRESIESVIGQTYRDWELILIDNGSTDNSPEILDEYRTHAQVRVIRYEQNRPLTMILNIGVAEARGKYWSLLHSDDYYLPEKLERQVAAFDDLPEDYGVVYSPGYRLDELTRRRWLDNTLKVSGFILKDMLSTQAEGINPISPLIRRNCSLEYPFHEDVFIEGESIFWRIAMKYKFRYLDEPLVVMREHAGNRGRAIKLNAQAVLILIDKLTRELEFPPGLLADLHRFRRHFMGVCGWLGIREAADPQWARSCLMLAIEGEPKQLFRPRTLAGLALSTLPAGAIRAINKALNMARGKQTVAVKTDYS